MAQLQGGKQGETDKRRLLMRLHELKEKKREAVDEDYLKNYKPHEKQRTFHANDATIRLFLGGNQCGKSRGGYSESVAFALGYRPWDGTPTAQPPNKVLIVGPDFKNHHSEITLPYLRRMIPKSALESVTRGNQGEISKFNFKNGSIIKLMSNEQHLKKAAGQVSPFEGHMWDFIHFDEPPPYGVFTACHRGIIARKGRMIFTLTPLRCPWLFDKLYMRAGNVSPDGGDDVFAIEVQIHDNPHLDEKWKSSYLQSLSADEREAREFGKFMHLIGLVYKGYDPMVHKIKRSNLEIQPHWPKGMVMDPHDRKPCALAWFTVTPEGDLIFFDEWPRTPFYDMTTCPFRHQIDKYAEMIRETEYNIPGGPDSVLYRLMDPNFGHSGKLGMIDNSIVDAFAKHRLFFRTDIIDDVYQGHMAVNSLMNYDNESPLTAINKPKVFFTDNLYNMHYGLSHYLWDEWRMDGKAVKEKPSDEFKDFPDLLRYTAVFGPRYINVAEMLSQRGSFDPVIGMSNSGLG